MHERRVCRRDIAAEIDAAENGKAAVCISPRRCRCCTVTPLMPRAQKSGGEDKKTGARGVSRNCCTIRAAISSVCWRASLLYYNIQRVPRSTRSCAAHTRRRRRCEIDAPDWLSWWNCASSIRRRRGCVKTRENKSRLYRCSLRYGTFGFTRISCLLNLTRYVRN